MCIHNYNIVQSIVTALKTLHALLIHLSPTPNFISKNISKFETENRVTVKLTTQVLQMLTFCSTSFRSIFKKENIAVTA